MFDIYQLLFSAEVTSAIELDEECGSALRGNLLEAVWKHSCANQTCVHCADCPLHKVCPVSALISPLREEHPRGRDTPRPYIVYPPLGKARRYEPGHTLQFGFSLFGTIIHYFPYVALSLKFLEESGLGRKLQEHKGQRGHFKVKRIEAYNPVSGERAIVYEADKPRIIIPTLAVTATDIEIRAKTLPVDLITLSFLTPTRIVDRGVPSPRPSFTVIMKRLFERLTLLQEAYGNGEKSLTILQSKVDMEYLADAVICQADQRHWKEVESYSFRQKQRLNISGFVGDVTFAGNLAPFREMLVWGELVRVGKGAVKGNGWYKVAQY